ncbi:hypothetical protein GCK32_021227 [Trichostrongylus colubriformis]|uniref:Uncharacterized protein n=1 Tax=Trichostrongylus colubriformis TaxID=6319 RepID=A0AAN8IG41_TRICO
MNGYTTTLYLVKIAVDRSPEQAALYFDKVLNLAKIPDGTYKQPCFVAIAENLSDLAWSICKYLVALTILTLIMTLLVIVILLYNSGQGQLLPQLNRVGGFLIDQFLLPFHTFSRMYTYDAAFTQLRCFPSSECVPLGQKTRVAVSHAQCDGTCA